MTKIDEMLLAAQQGKATSDDFYNLFLNSEIFIPLIEPPDPADPRSIKPILIEADGKNYLMMFDAEERLSAWAKRKIDFAALSGHGIVQMMDPSMSWILNVGTEHMKQFVPEEIAWLKESIAPSL
jgi:hypothetical protein